MPSIRIILVILLALGAVEGVAYWWMHPAPAGQGDPVLVYRPVNRDQKTEDGGRKTGDGGQESEDKGQATGDRGQEEATAPALDPAQSTFSIQNSPFKIHHSHTPLPEIASRAIPVLRCSTGTAARIDRDDGVTVHIAFFEWDLADSNNVLEAFKHLPDECMGSLGMTLTAKHPPRTYVVRGRESRASDNEPLEKWRSRNGLDGAQRSQTEDGGRQSEDGGQKTEIKETSASSSSIHHSPFTIHHSLSSSETLTFDHTTFRDPTGVVVHAFKGTWVSGAANLLGPNVRGGADQWRQIRSKSAIKRFNPAHARVAQGAVRGIPNPELAWKIFEETMLVDMKMEKAERVITSN